MGIGIDGSRACDAFGSGKPTGFRGTMWLNSANHGAHRRQAAARLDQGRQGAAGPDLHRSGVHHRRRTSPGLQGEALQVELRPCNCDGAGRLGPVADDDADASRSLVLTQHRILRARACLQALRRRAGARATCRSTFRPGEIAGAGRRERRRQVDADAHPRRRASRPTAAAHAVDGAPSVFREPREAHAAGIRVIHQEPEIVPELTVAENIFVGDMPTSRGHPARLARARGADPPPCSRASAWTATCGRAQLCATLGPAQRQMIEIMRAVRAGGRLIAFDEPTSSLTDDEARRLFAIIRQLRADGVGDRLHLAPAERDHRASPTASPCCATAGWSTIRPPPAPASRPSRS